MPTDHKFAVFSQDGMGAPLWKGFFNDLAEARQRAQNCVSAEGVEAFIFDFDSAFEVARFFPEQHTPEGPDHGRVGPKYRGEPDVSLRAASMALKPGVAENGQ